MSNTYINWLFAAIAVLLVLLPVATGQGAPAVFSLDSTDGLKSRQVQADVVEFKGRKAVRLVQAPDAKGESVMAIIAGVDFQDGTIELELAGEPSAGAGSGARGFVGIAFRVAEDASKFECIYLRPTNGRAEDQLRRNHTTQYTSYPDYPWSRLREETPGKYESYVDLQPGVWTKVKIVVKGTEARLYVHDGEQPCLLVNDLKHGESRGAIGLWPGPGSDTYFSNLKVTTQ